jgi:methionine biosynthesis protein MetW
MGSRKSHYFMSLLNDIKHWMRDLIRYPAYRPLDESYDTYWSSRDTSSLNTFQLERIRLISQHIAGGDSILDIGCGDGRILDALKKSVAGIHVSGIDSSPHAIIAASLRGITVRQADLRELSTLEQNPADWVLALEVLEHVQNSEELLVWARSCARKGVIFSVPNTGFIMHRLRLLFGRFPLQWRVHPGEHIRFWTLRDLEWWLKSLGYNYAITPYKGVPVLNSLIPSLFSQGLFIVITDA